MITIFIIETFSQVNLKDLLSVSIEIAERGGMEAVRYKAYHRTHAGNKGQTREQAKELKTEGARRSYSAIMAGFLKTFPLLSTRVGISSPENISRSMVVVGYIQLFYKEKSRGSAAFAKYFLDVCAVGVLYE